MTKLSEVSRSSVQVPPTKPGCRRTPGTIIVSRPARCSASRSRSIRKVARVACVGVDIQAALHRAPGASSLAERPGHHQRELLGPERAAVLPLTLLHDNVGVHLAKRSRPTPGVVEEERLLRASNEVDARKWAGQRLRRLEAGTGRRCEDGAVDVGVAKSHCKRELSTEGRTPHTGALDAQCDSK